MRNAIGAGHRPGARSRRTAVTEDAEAKSELATDFGISRETVYAYLRAAPGPARTNPGLDARPRFEPTDRLGPKGEPGQLDVKALDTAAGQYRR
ncbi:hypothetical protein [Nocardia fluminea]|uniref:hypothetical protein n=1 Tax=Nocardia fluminea TaxID=134984 RepID=UPI0037AA996C